MDYETKVCSGCLILYMCVFFFCVGYDDQSAGMYRCWCFVAKVCACVNVMLPDDHCREKPLKVGMYEMYYNKKYI